MLVVLLFFLRFFPQLQPPFCVVKLRYSAKLWWLLVLPEFTRELFDWKSLTLSWTGNGFVVTLESLFSQTQLKIICLATIEYNFLKTYSEEHFKGFLWNFCDDRGHIKKIKLTIAFLSIPLSKLLYCKSRADNEKQLAKIVFVTSVQMHPLADK